MTEIGNVSSLFEVMRIDENVRAPKTPAGLKNVGNTCFINSLLQAYFMIHPLVKEVMMANFEGLVNPDSSLKFLKSLQDLFGKMIGSMRKYIDPSSTLDSLIASNGNKILLGDQKDIGEFHMVFVENLERGLNNSKQESQVLLETLKKQGKINSLFNGTQAEYIRYKINNNEVQKLAKKINFSQIILDVDEGNLMQAWEKSCCEEIKNLRTENDEVVDAVKEIWFEELPSVLMFQIKRHFYVPGDPYPSKNNQIFEFPLELYTDQVMLCNKKKVRALRKEASNLKHKIKKIRKEIGKLKSGFGNNIINSFNSVLEFLEDKKFENLYSEKNKKKVVENLSKIKTNIEEEIDRLTKELEVSEKSLQEMFSALNSNKYILQTILIHEGSAMSGHYYAFIYDEDSEIWRKYNDVFVKEVSFEEVKNNSIGGDNSGVSAYCLIYINEAKCKNTSGLPRHLFNPSFPIEYCDEYTTFLSESICKFINIENKNDDDERQSLSIKETRVHIFNDFNAKVLTINRIASRECISPFNIRNYSNFCIYLYSISKKSLAMWYVFDITVFDHIGQRLNEIKNMGVINSLLELRNRNNMVPNFELSKNEKEDIVKLFPLYKNNKKGLIVIVFILEEANAFKQNICAKATVAFSQIGAGSSDILTLFEKTCMILYLSSAINFLVAIKSKDISRVIEVCQNINYIGLALEESKFKSNVLKAIKDIKNKYFSDFNNKEKREIEKAVDVALLKDLDTSVFMKNEYEEIEKLNDKLENNDYYKWDTGTERFIYDAELAINRFFNETYKNIRIIFERVSKKASIEIRDLE